MLAYQAGAGVLELAALFGIGRDTVSQHLTRQGVGRRRRGLDESQVSEAARLYVEGWSLKRLEAKFGVDAETVRQALKRHGVAMRPRNGWEGRKPKP